MNIKFPIYVHNLIQHFPQTRRIKLNGKSGAEVYLKQKKKATNQARRVSPPLCK